MDYLRHTTWISKELQEIFLEITCIAGPLTMAGLYTVQR